LSLHLYIKSWTASMNLRNDTYMLRNGLAYCVICYKDMICRGWGKADVNKSCLIIPGVWCTILRKCSENNRHIILKDKKQHKNTEKQCLWPCTCFYSCLRRYIDTCITIYMQSSCTATLCFYIMLFLLWHKLLYNSC
jgi:hypothetical protein